MKTTKIEWIPCSKKLPVHPGFYLVTKKLRDNTKPFVTKEYFQTGAGWVDSEYGTKVLAWAPKIEPWKPEK